VVIGRNEGERLRRCLASIRDAPGASASDVIVYVDSGSTDSSCALAREHGADVVELDLERPFTAARARNAGFERLLAIAPATEFVQFVDGDCELRRGWIETGVRALRDQTDVAVVCGRRRERASDHSVYDRLCDIEWDTPVGDARACGGDALMRVSAFRGVGGFDATMIAGEEPELCLRLARSGFRIVRLHAEMTLHDAAMTRWTQWWQRAVRTGHTTAELLAKHGDAREHRRLRRASSAIAWGVALPLVAGGVLAWAVWSANPAAIVAAVSLPLVAYALLLVRITRRCAVTGRCGADARAYAFSCVLAKWPECWGMALYVVRRAAGRRARWIEYKDGPRGLRGAAPEHARPSGS
jgi:GT2 family glycosyltransferase